MPGTLPDDSSHARFLFELKMQTQPTFNPPSSANVEESKSSPNLATRITGWTSNFLATAVVIVLALTVGRQLVFYWSDASTEPVASDLVEAWPMLESCALEFGNSPYQLQRTQLMTTGEGVLNSLGQKCKNLLVNQGEQAQPVGPPTEAELKMIERSADLVPMAQEKGKWRIFNVDQAVGGIELPTVLGIRDDLENEQGKTESRLVVWGMALKGQSVQRPVPPQAPTETKEGQPEASDLPEVASWTTYVCHPSVTKNEVPIPDESQRTMSISDSRGARLTGFAGGDIEDAKQFFDDWSVENDWQRIGSWQETSQAMVARFDAADRLGQRMQIRLSRDQEILRGLITVGPLAETEPPQQSNKTN